MFSRRHTVLPDAPIYTLTWGISDVFGGITSSAVQRTSAFAQQGHRDIEFVTLDPETDPKRRKKELVEQGWLDKRVKVRNLWADLRKLHDRNLQQLAGNIEERVIVSRSDLLKQGKGLTAERKNADETVIQTDYYRADGTILASDKHDFDKPDIRKGRVITLFTSLGMQLGQWTNMSDFYFSWLDYITKGKPAVIITDSPGIGGRMRNYDRPNIVKAQVLHNFHLAEPTSSLDGSIAPRWKNIIVNSDKYDVLAVLTDQQRQDLNESQADPGNLMTVSNMFRGDLVDDIQPRPRDLGIQVSRLAVEKRVDHSLKAIAQVDGARLDVYGFAHTPELEQGLEALLKELDISDRAVLRGYDRKAKEYFKLASFSLLPSLYEGQGLVLLESMASGCIPIAYDIKYGPASIIDHRVDGFLVPPGDIDALAQAIKHVMKMGDDDLRAMRQAAVKKAREYTPEKIVGRWGEVLREALAKKKSIPETGGQAELNSISADEDSVSVEIAVTGLPATPDWAAVAWKSRSFDLYGRTAAKVEQDGDDVRIAAEIPVSRIDHGQENIFDIFADVRSADVTVRLRVTANESDMPSPGESVEPYLTANGNFSITVHPAQE